MADIFTEVGPGGFAEAVDGEGAVLAEVDLVGVHLEDLLLGEAMFELEGDNDLDELAFELLLRGKKEAARELHGERGATLAFAAGEQVVAQCAYQADVVDAAVIEEAAVFDGGDGLDEVRRQLGVGDQVALGAVSPSESPVMSCGSSS